VGNSSVGQRVDDTDCDEKMTSNCGDLQMYRKRGYFSILSSVWHISWLASILLFIVTIFLFGVYVVFIRFMRAIVEGRNTIEEPVEEKDPDEE